MHWLKHWATYIAMGPLELYGHLSGARRISPPMPAHPIRNAPADSRRAIVAYGDSLTEGKGAVTGCGYPEQLARYIGQPVINRGTGGLLAMHGCEEDRLHSEVLALNPGIVIIGFGGNDMMARRPTHEVFADLRHIVETVQDHGAVAVLLGISGSWLFKVDYSTPYRELAVATGAAVVEDSLYGIWGKPWLMADAAHPNRRGYAILAQRVARVVLPLLR